MFFLVVPPLVLKATMLFLNTHIREEEGRFFETICSTLALLQNDLDVISKLGILMLEGELEGHRQRSLESEVCRDRWRWEIIFVSDYRAMAIDDGMSCSLSFSCWEGGMLAS